MQVAGAVVLDDGAVHALMSGGRSLLAVGVKSVNGEFSRGDVIDCRAPDGRAIGRGIVNYGSADVRRIAGHPSTEIEQLLGFIEEPELIHRDNFVLL